MWQTQYTTMDTGSYHAYGCHVTASTVTWYRDGVETYTATYDGVSEPWYPLFDYGRLGETPAPGSRRS